MRLSQNHRGAAIRAAFVLVFLLVIAGGVLVYQAVHSLSDRSSKQDQVITKLANGLDTTRGQLQNSGIQPSVPSADQIIKEVPGIPGPTGPAGPRGAPGDSVVGPSGPSGPAGPTGSPGATGAPGKDGVSGKDGSPGAAGKDGAAGAKGDTGAVGPAGPQGPQGAQGAQGPQGEPGGAPSMYTLRWSDGKVFQCVRSETEETSFDCTQQPGSEPSSGVGGSSDNGGQGDGIPVALGALYAVVQGRKYS